MKVDTRAGSQEYLAPLQALGIPAEPAQLPAGDVSWIGRGVKGAPIPVGVEIKKWSDLLTCVRDGRFADQLKKMNDVYQVKWLLIEGPWRVDHEGFVELPTLEGFWRRADGHYRIQEVYSWLFTMVQCGGILLWVSPSQSYSVAWLRSLWLWWTGKDYEEHRAHLDWYRPPLPPTPWISEPQPVQIVARVFPGIGSHLCALVSEEFPSVEEMVTASPERWQKVEGIGKKLATKVREFLTRRSR